MNLANRITVFRIILIPFFVGLILKYNQLAGYQGELLRWVALTIFAVAVISDAVDGYVARRRQQITELGKVLDPIADKMLLLSAILILSFPGRFARLPVWFVVTVLSRDVIIVIGAVLLHLLTGRVKIAPSLWGKATTVAQMIVVLWILIGLDYPHLAWRTAGALTVLSGIGYILSGSKQLNEATESPA